MSGSTSLLAQSQGPTPPLDAAALAKALELTPEQASQIARTVEAHNAAEQSLRTDLEKARAAQAGLREKMKAVLTADQQKKLIAADLLGTYQDHPYMMEQLGITRLRPGKNGSKQEGPGFDLATANPWKDTMPDLLKCKDGTVVKTPDQWPARRREIQEDFAREIYGRVPENAPAVTWNILTTTTGQTAGIPTITRKLAGTVDNSRYPALSVVIQASITVPVSTAGPVPLLVAFGGGGLEHAIPHGWASGTLDPNSIQADAGGMALRQGVIGITSQGQPRRRPEGADGLHGRHQAHRRHPRAATSSSTRSPRRGPAGPPRVATAPGRCRVRRAAR